MENPNYWSETQGRETGRAGLPDPWLADPARIGRYRIIRPLGQGGFGRVYLGHDDDLDRSVAIKVPNPERVADLQDVEAYLAEARALAKLDHPNIVPVYDFGRTDDGHCYVVSKFIDGSDLSERLTHRRPSVREAVEMTAVVATALHHAHTRGLVHRDIKPANILLDASNAPWVADFGLALKDEDYGKGARLAGTPAYMSPEQARGEGHRVDGRSDLFSLGVVLYELLTGRKPFRGETRVEVMEQIITGEPRPLRQIDDTIPRELERICQKALAKRASERYSTGRDMAEDLCHFLQTDAAAATAPAAAPTVTPSALAPAPPSTQEVTPATITPVRSESESRTVKIVPKGLRSFDRHDADFFLELLPGPRDRDGLPDNLRFWKTRIETTDPDATFRVGLIYGPSGCGKSSLVKAGLLPRLAKHVLPVYIEATREETESRLKKGLLKVCPDVPADATLVDALTALRRGRIIRPGEKVLLVIDQFEQWLFAQQDEPENALVAALRQCDGEHLQAVVMVRDDFWMAATRFMRDLEIRLVEGENSAAVDLFDLLHARRVLGAYGRAYGVLPEKTSDLTSDQRAFLEQSVAGLAQNGKVISVRLALFAEMVKGKPWSPATLKEVGGTQGVGVTFLEETFSSSTAPPEHRLHQKAAQAVLKALLPESGTDIKGQRRSEAELRSASSYASRPREFDDLIQILDSELRLITPSDVDSALGDGQPDQPIGQRFYQLTHDYLVHSLRDWLTRKQKETRRGRAELRLAERAAIWEAKPESRHLPSLLEWARICIFSSTKDWTVPQRQMMRRASRFHGLRSIALAAVVAVLATVALNASRQQAEARRAKESAALRRVDELLKADIAEVPDRIQAIEEDRATVDPKLRRVIDERWVAPAVKLRASLALLPVDATQVDYLATRFLDPDPQQVQVLGEALVRFRDAVVPSLWADLEAAKPGSAGILPLGGALARYDPGAERWGNLGPKLAEALVSVGSDSVRPWLGALRPVRRQLTVPLEAIFREKRRPDTEHAIATAVLAEYASADPELLARLLVIADPKAFEALFQFADAQAEKIVPLLHAELAKGSPRSWNEPALDPSWTRTDATLTNRIEAAQGLVGDRFAFCQTLALDESAGALRELQKAGYRAIRFRPYADGSVVRVAAVWTRDGRSCRVEPDLSATEAQQQIEKSRSEGYAPVDIAGYVRPGSDGKPSERYAVVWAQAAEPANVLACVGATAAKATEIAEQFRSDELVPRTTQVTLGADGLPRYSGIWEKPPTEGEARQVEWDLFEADLTASGAKRGSEAMVDVAVTAAEASASVSARAKAARDRARAALEKTPGSISARSDRAGANFRLGETAKAFEDFDYVVERIPDDIEALQYRAITRARLGKRNEALQDLATLKSAYAPEHSQLFLETVVSAELGESIEKPLGSLRAMIAERQDDAARYSAVRALAMASQAVAPKDRALGHRLASQALAFLKELVAHQGADFGRIESDPALDPIRDDPEFEAFVQASTPDRRYAAVWIPATEFEAKVLHGRSPAEQLEASRALVKDGYRPVAWSVARTRPTGPVVSTCVWHRPLVSQERKDELAASQARALVALVRMGHADGNLSCLQHSVDPRLRSFVVNWLRLLGVNAGAVVKEFLHFEQSARPFVASRQSTMDEILFHRETSTRRALILALGTYAVPDLPASDRQALCNKLLDLYRNDPDAGIHGAAGWTLRRWDQEQQLKALDDALATDKLAGDHRWFINSQGLTFAVINGPARFHTGSPGNEIGRIAAYEPIRGVTIPRRYAISTKEVTVAQFQRFASTASEFAVERSVLNRFTTSPDGPWIASTWYAAAAYCNWLSAQAGLPKDEWCYVPNGSNVYAEAMTIPANVLERKGYRLPTEPEWEYACRAGTITSRYYGDSDQLLGEYAWWQANSAQRAARTGTLKPNDLGLFDMLGNVYEWSQDRMAAYRPISKGVFIDQTALAERLVDRRNRILRGGTNSDLPSEMRSASRAGDVPTLSNNLIGFRVAKTCD